MVLPAPVVLVKALGWAQGLAFVVLRCAWKWGSLGRPPQSAWVGSIVLASSWSEIVSAGRRQGLRWPCRQWHHRRCRSAACRVERSLLCRV